MPGSDFLQLRLFPEALFGRVQAAARETAGLRQIHGGGNLTLQDNPLSPVFQLRHRNGAEQRLGVGMGRMGKELVKTTRNASRFGSF